MNAEAATGYVLLKKVFLEIQQNSQENTCGRDSFLIKLQAWGGNLRNFQGHLFYRIHPGDCFWYKNNFSYNCNQRNKKKIKKIKETKRNPIAIKWTAKAKTCYFSLCRFLNDTALSLWTESVIIFLLLLK